MSAALIPVTVTLSISPAVYRPAEVTGELVRKALEQHRKRNARMAKYMRGWRAGERKTKGSGK